MPVDLDARFCGEPQSCGADVIKVEVVEGLGQVHVPADASVLSACQVPVEDTLGDRRAAQDGNGRSQDKPYGQDPLQPQADWPQQ